jgi:bacillithiol biosynthesis deacetylase BshB1
MNLDVLVFAAHPDDAELSMGGTIARLAKNNFKVGIVDFTRGELGTRGSSEIRQKEAFQAAISLKAVLRENLDIPDGNIEENKENTSKVVMSIRRFKPKIVFAPYFNDRHPDHCNTSHIVKKAFFLSGLPKIKTFDKEKAQDAYRPVKIYYYMQTYTFPPSFIVDISDSFAEKMKAVSCYTSQFYNPKSVEPETFISQPNFLKFVESRNQVYGFKIGKNYGEPFFSEEEIEFDLIGSLK